ncbi:NmrA family NAD(P)-binding protein [Streptomyces violaceoruber]|uniref:NmrA family NAD(P)-binding protein n=1 Tax=Streptomyces violaceoruber TaxID=1935 RepID=UPI001F1865E1|nr:NmrA family NAD(P)-binding protein [Streptomyces violaceoruber]MCF3170348.1 NmrA family NAD(P)-binding protein [Streptomyces violaceoruber]
MTENTYTRSDDDNPRGNGFTGEAAASTGTVLVTSATGKSGRRVAERLTALGVPVRPGSRTGGVPFDWEDDSGWAAALAGVRAAYVAYYPDLAVPGAAEAMAAFGRTAAACGVRRVVLLSGRGEPQAVVAEEALRGAAGPVEVTVVRSAFFAQNFSEGALLDGVAGGELVFPAGTTAEPFLDLDDLADVVVAALTGDGHAGAVYELTGPRCLTFAEAAEVLGRVTGRPVRYVPVSGPAYAELLEGFGAPGPEAGFLADLFATLLDGHNAATTDGVKRILGREPKDFAVFAHEAAGDGAWHR